MKILKTQLLFILLGVEDTWTVVRRYYLAFRLDYLNRSERSFKVVPSFNKEILTQNRTAWQDTDHARTNNISLDNEYKVSASLLFIVGSRRQSSPISLVRRYSCKVGDDNSKWDRVLNTNILTHSGQDASTNEQANLRHLQNMKKEIRYESKLLKPMLVSEINRNIWPMLKHSKQIRMLVVWKQKYLALLSSVYGLRSTQVESQILEWLSNLDMRIFAIETIYRSQGSRTPGVDGFLLSKENLLHQLDILTENSLLKYKSSPIKRVFIPKGKGRGVRPLGILTIKDRIVQTLFVQVIEPVIDPHADLYSYGYRKGRSAHQAIGELSRILNVHPYLRRSSEKTKRYFSHSKFILQVDIEGFFDNVNHKFLLENYPMPVKYKKILQSWLSAPICYQTKELDQLTGFPQGSIIGPSLANYTLNGLEFIIKPSQCTAFDKEKSNFLAARSEYYMPGQSNVRKTLYSRIIRFADDFIIIVNDENEANKVWFKLEKFLDSKGLKINEEKSSIMKWKNGVKFNYLGFTFHYINNPKKSVVTEQRKGSVVSLRGGLYVYPSKEKVNDFKKKIKGLLTENLNWSPYQIVEALNPIIRGWGNYYCIGTLRQFSRLDHFIYYRTWRYLRRKYQKVAVGRLVERFYQGVSTPTGRAWQFHGTWNKAPKNLTSRKGNISWLLLLCKLLKPMPAHMFRANNEVLKISFYISPIAYKNWALNLFTKRNVGKITNNWSELYKKQRGVCTECGQSLGYLLSENLEIHHVKQMASSGPKDRVNRLSNLKLIHKTCHRSIPVLK